MYYPSKYRVGLDDMVGKTIKEVVGLVKYSDEVIITTTCGDIYKFFHMQDCCEQVNLEDFEGGVEDLVGGVILSALEVEGVCEEPDMTFEESHTWTFYKIETTKGGLWMRWLGESNGYYSEGVDFIKLTMEG